MRTVQSLINELRKFPKDSPCYAYEGEVFGVVVMPKVKRPTTNNTPPISCGVIHCGESTLEADELETRPIGD